MQAKDAVRVNLGEGRQALAIRSHFFEFVEVDDWESGEKKALLCHELEVGRQYYILFTTSGGLYRYHINDIVKVVGWYNRTPSSNFSTRAAIFLLSPARN